MLESSYPANLPPACQQAAFIVRRFVEKACLPHNNNKGSLNVSMSERWRVSFSTCPDRVEMNCRNRSFLTPPPRATRSRGAMIVVVVISLKKRLSIERIESLKAICTKLGHLAWRTSYSYSALSIAITRPTLSINSTRRIIL